MPRAPRPARRGSRRALTCSALFEKFTERAIKSISIAQAQAKQGLTKQEVGHLPVCEGGEASVLQRIRVDTHSGIVWHKISGVWGVGLGSLPFFLGLLYF